MLTLPRSPLRTPAKENAYFKELVKSAEACRPIRTGKREEAESRYESALADISGLKEQNAQLQQSYHDADESRIGANLQRQKAEAERYKAEARAKDSENQFPAPGRWPKRPSPGG